MVFLAEDGGIGALGINLPSLIAQLINFTILLIVLGWAFKRFLFPLLDERRKRIEEGLDASEGAKRRRGEIQLERDAAIADLRKEFADLTMTAAERVIRRSLDRKAHQEIIEEVLAEAPGGEGGDGQT